MKLFCLSSIPPKMKYLVRNMSNKAKKEVTTSDSIKVIASFNMDELDDVVYSDTIDSILEHFPSYNKFYKEVKVESEIKSPADRYFFIEFKKDGCEPMRALYSYLNFYLLAIVAVGKIFVLQDSDFGVPDYLLEGKEKVPVNCGVGYTTIPVKVIYSLDDLRDAVKALSKGFKEGKMPWFVSSIARIVGMTAESSRNKEMRDFVNSVLDPEIHAQAFPSGRLILMFKNWSKMSKFVRSADDNDQLVLDEGIIFIKREMGSVLSLLHRKDGSKAEKNGKENVASAGSGGKSIQSGGSGGISALSCTSIHAGSGGKSIQSGGSGGISALSCTSIHAGSGEKSIQSGGSGGISALSCTSIDADCGMGRHVRDDGPVLTFEESWVTKFAGCGMMRQWGRKHSFFGFEESGVRGQGVLGLGVMTKWGGKHRSVSIPERIPEQSGATESACNQSGVLGGMVRQLGCGMVRWQECPFTTLAGELSVNIF